MPEDEEGSDLEEEQEEEMDGIDPNEDRIVGEILEKFLVGTEATFLEEVNLMLMVKALSNRLIINDLENFEMFNMNTLQMSLIKFINASQVNSFEFFDKKNDVRVQNIRTKIIQ